MAEKPILFSAPMVQALLAGKKTQTRRLVKPQADYRWLCPGCLGSPNRTGTTCEECGNLCAVPKYQVGDLLWVREGWRTRDAYDLDSPSRIVNAAPVQYKDLLSESRGVAWGRWRSSLHMPRWASRISLKVTGVNVERVQSISREDAAAEGICYLSEIGFDKQYKDRQGHMMNVIQNHRWPEENFGHLWQLINGAESWERNDWVFAYTFEVQNG